jgi:hypothetical protein
MRRTSTALTALLSGLIVLSTATPAPACGYVAPSPLVQFALADCVVVGQVTAIEDKTQLAMPYPGAPQKQEYKIAVVRILNGLKGAHGLTHVRIGVPAPQTFPPGYEACFFLTPHFEESFFFTSRIDADPIRNTDNLGFRKEVVAQYERWGKLLDDPRAALQSKDADERILTAALLITRYRTYQRGVHTQKAKTEPIDAALSKLILEVLAGADWGKPITDYRTTGQRLFYLLGPTPQDGWNPPAFKDAKEFETAAKTWLKEHAATFCIAAFVRQ